VGVHYASEWNTTALPPRRLGQQVLVLAEENTPERCGTIEQIGIIEFGCTICLNGHDINASVQQGYGYCSPNMDIHVQGQAHWLAQLAEVFEPLLKWRFAGL